MQFSIKRKGRQKTKREEKRRRKKSREAGLVEDKETA